MLVAKLGGGWEKTGGAAAQPRTAPERTHSVLTTKYKYSKRVLVGCSVDFPNKGLGVKFYGRLLFLALTSRNTGLRLFCIH